MAVCSGWLPELEQAGGVVSAGGEADTTSCTLQYSHCWKACSELHGAAGDLNAGG